MKILESTFYTLRLFSIIASGACTARQSVASLAIHFQKVDSSVGEWIATQSLPRLLASERNGLSLRENPQGFSWQSIQKYINPLESTFSNNALFLNQPFPCHCERTCPRGNPQKQGVAVASLVIHNKKHKP